MNSRVFLFSSAVLFILAAVATHGAGAPVFGSYAQGELARQQAAAVEARLGIDARVVEAEVNGRRYYRVMGPHGTDAEARSMVVHARANGFSDTWFLPGDTSNPSIAPAPAARPEERTAVAERPAAAPADESTESVRRTTVRLRPGTSLITEDPDSSIALTRVNRGAIKLDGIVDEDVWADAPAYDNMLVMDPDTLAEPQHGTVTRFLYSDAGLYVSAVMEQPPETLVQRLSARDEFINRDSFGITLDTSGEGLYGFWFVINLGGAKMDGKVAPERSFTNQWDGAWVGETAQTPDGWTTELFIPWGIISMPSSGEIRQMAFWVNRKVAYLDERYGWPALPFGSARFMSALQPMDIKGINPRQQWEAFPYASATADGIKSETEGRAGVDLSWRPTSNLQLTATLNPDFGAVESDDVVVNLSAFETFFPEKRLFFLEGTEVFVTSPRSNPRTGSGPGGSGGRTPPQLFTLEPTTLLNTRRIGGSAKHAAIPDDIEVEGIEQSKPTELVGAAKLVGQAGGLRYGLLTAFEQEAELDGRDIATGERRVVTAEGRDFHIARLLYERSGAGRQSIGYIGTAALKPDGDAYVHGVDAHWLSASGKWGVDSQVMASDTEVDGYGMFTDINYTPATGKTHRLSIDAIDRNLDISDLGFIRRNDDISLRYRYFQSSSRNLPSWLRSQRIGVFASAAQNNDQQLTNSFLGVFASWLLNDRSEIRTEIDWLPGVWDDRNSRGNGVYRRQPGYFWFVSYGTSSARKLSWSVQTGVQAEDLGDPAYFTDLGFTYRPVDRFSLDFDFRWRKRNGWLVHMDDRDFTTFSAIDLQPRLAIDYFITAKQQFRLTMQWAGIEADQDEFFYVPYDTGPLVNRIKDPTAPVDDFTISRLTAQARYRWEIGPLSDLFVVYTRGANLDNRIDDDFGSLFVDALEEPIVDVLIVKLRYRFGS